MGNCTVTFRRRTGVMPTGVGEIVDIALSSGYATGGDTVPLAALGVRNLQALSLCAAVTSPAGHPVEIIHGATETTAPLLRVRDVVTGAEITAATNLSAQTLRGIVMGEMSNP